MRRKRRILLGSLVLGVAIGGGIAFWLNSGLTPMPWGKPVYVRFEAQTPLRQALERLREMGVVRNPAAFQVFSRIKRYPQVVGEGTYSVRPGMKAHQVLNAIRLPIRQLVRLPETNWASRNAKIIEENGVASAEEYLALVKHPQAFANAVSFPLPASGSLEGYLYPDTYDLPPLLGARGAIERQLRAFEEKVWKPMGEPKDLRRAVIVASLVQMEVARDSERPIVAGVIENRLRLKMPLQIDAAVLYGMGTWKALTRADIQSANSVYNTYKHSGLPPGPICSPSADSVAAALKPAKHDYLYYVAMPEGYHLFSATYSQHLANIRKRKEALSKLGR